MSVGAANALGYATYLVPRLNRSYGGFGGVDATRCNMR